MYNKSERRKFKHGALPCSAVHSYTPDFLTNQEAQRLLHRLEDPQKLYWRREQFTLFGKRVEVPRQLTWFGDAGINYRYTGLDHVAAGWPDGLVSVKDRICEATKLDFNFVLLNRYDHGEEYMGWHRDDEKSAAPIIASLSLGNMRRFRYRQDAKLPIHAIDLTHGSLLIFDGRCQHTLAKTAKEVGTRINLTFRFIKPRPGQLAPIAR